MSGNVKQFNGYKENRTREGWQGNFFWKKWKASSWGKPHMSPWDKMGYILLAEKQNTNMVAGELLAGKKAKR